MSDSEFGDQMQRFGSLRLPPLTIILDDDGLPEPLYDANCDDITLTAKVEAWCRETLSPGWCFRNVLCEIVVSGDEANYAGPTRFTVRLPLMQFACEADMLAFRLRWL